MRNRLSSPDCSGEKQHLLAAVIEGDGATGGVLTGLDGGRGGGHHESRPAHTHNARHHRSGGVTVFWRQRLVPNQINFKKLVAIRESLRRRHARVVPRPTALSRVVHSDITTQFPE